MTTPPTIQTNPLGPSPFQVAITQGDRVTNAWNQWFTQAQQKINVINLTLATLSGGSITPEGYLSISSGGTSAGSATDAFNNLSPLTTNGDMLIYNSGNIRLPAGTDGYVLQVVSGIPTWVNASAGSSPLTTKGDVYGFNTAPARIPVGADSYVLTADSTNSLGVSWKPAGTPTLPVTTKGDILGYSTVPARIPVGTDGTALLADSTQPLGVKWGTPAGTSPLTTKGDLYGYSTVSTRIPVGVNNQTLLADSTQTSGIGWFYGFPGKFSPPTASTFTIIDSSTTLTDLPGRLLASNSTSVSHIQPCTVAIGFSAPFTIDIGFYFTAGNTNITNSLLFGLCISDGTKYKGILIGTNANGLIQYLISTPNYITDYTTVLTSFICIGHPSYIRITNDGTNRNYYLSSNGLDYCLVYSEAFNTFLTETSAGFCFYGSAKKQCISSIVNWNIKNSV